MCWGVTHGPQRMCEEQKTIFRSWFSFYYELQGSNGIQHPTARLTKMSYTIRHPGEAARERHRGAASEGKRFPCAPEGAQSLCIISPALNSGHRLEGHLPGKVDNDLSIENVYWGNHKPRSIPPESRQAFSVNCAMSSGVRPLESFTAGAMETSVRGAG